mmetsp:Transcript_32151/g.44583  ORF Transcript_32151/g.44583 Transcript_32151/m.44583 type:complete len:160 (+) Transcript_32151:221-700(+)
MVGKRASIGGLPASAARSEGSISHRYAERNLEEEEHAPACRICLEPAGVEGDLCSPCRCKGSMKFVHKTCLRKWQAASHACHTFRQRQRRELVCPMCHGKYTGQARGSPVVRVTRLAWSYFHHEVAPKLAVLAVGFILDRGIKRVLPKVHVTTTIQMRV